MPCEEIVETLWMQKMKGEKHNRRSEGEMLQMRDYITKLYEALENYDCEQVGKIYFGVRDDNISVGEEDIVPLCKMFTYEFQETEPVNDQLIVKITFHIIDRCGMETGLQELVKGLMEIYDRSIANYGNKKLPGNTYEGLMDYIKEYVNTFIASYSDEDMVLLGELIKTNTSLSFKDRLLEIVEKDLGDYEDEYLRKVRRITEDIVRRGKLLIENIKQ